jgi:hypothetical protein
MRQHERRVFLCRIIVGRGVDVGDDIEAVQCILHRMDIDLASLVLGDGAVIDEGERVLPVVGGDGLGHHCWHS